MKTRLFASHIFAFGTGPALLLSIGSLTAASITDSLTAPASGILFQGGTDNGTTSVRWRNNGTDTDLGSTFTVGQQGGILEGLTLRISGANFGSAVPGLPVMLDFFRFEAPATFTPLWRETGTLPTTTAADDFITLDLTGRGQMLEAGASYGFLLGVSSEDASGTDAGRFRLYTSATDTVPNAFEIRRDYEFGATRPELSVAPGTLNPTRDLLFYVTVVPEPSAVSLGLLGLCAWMMARRRSV